MKTAVNSKTRMWQFVRLKFFHLKPNVRRTAPRMFGWYFTTCLILMLEVSTISGVFRCFSKAGLHATSLSWSGLSLAIAFDQWVTEKSLSYGVIKHAFLVIINRHTCLTYGIALVAYLLTIMSINSFMAPPISSQAVFLSCSTTQGSRATSDSLPAPAHDRASPIVNCSSTWRICYNDSKSN